MARKKPEAIQALERIKPRCADCDDDAVVLFEKRNLCERHYVAASTRNAPNAMRAAGLDRRPGESSEHHRKRVFAYLRENATFKRFGVEGAVS